MDGNEVTVAQDAVFMADIDGDNLPETDETVEEDVGEVEEETDETPEEVEEDSKIVELEDKLSAAQKEINRLGFALRKKDTPKETKETPLTKQQLMNIFKEHQDEPEIVFQVMEELQKQGKVDAQEAAEKSLDIKNKKKETEAFINSLYPDAFKDGSELNTSIQNAIEWAHLDGHPFAHEAALGMMLIKNMPETIKEIREMAKKEAEELVSKQLKDKTEVARKKSIDAGKPGKSSGASGKETATLTPAQLETAKSLGLKSKEQLERYAKIVGKKG